MVEEPVEDGGGDGGVVEDRAPVGDAAVGGEDDRAVLVAARDDLEEVAGGLGRERDGNPRRDAEKDTGRRRTAAPLLRFAYGSATKRSGETRSPNLGNSDEHNRGVWRERGHRDSTAHLAPSAPTNSAERRSATCRAKYLQSSIPISQMTFS